MFSKTIFSKYLFKLFSKSFIDTALAFEPIISSSTSILRVQFANKFVHFLQVFRPLKMYVAKASSSSLNLKQFSASCNNIYIKFIHS